MSEISVDELSSYISLESMSIGSSSAYHKKAPVPDSSLHHPVELLSSYLEIGIQEGSKAYRYDVEIEASKSGSLTRGPADDGHGAMRRKVCYDLLYAALAKSKGFGTGQDYHMPLVYNRQNHVFFAQPLPEDFITIDLDDNADFTGITNYLYYMTGATESIQVKISKPQSEEHVLDLYESIFDTAPLDCDGNLEISSRDRSFRTFLELLTSGPASFTGSHVACGTSFYEATNGKDMKDGKTMRAGLKKGVCVIERDGILYPALVVDSKTGAFFKEQNLLKSMKEMNNGEVPRSAAEPMWQKARKLYKDVRVLVVSNVYKNSTQRRLTFPIQDFTREPASRQMMNMKGFRGTVEQYFRQKHNLSLLHPHLPCAIHASNSKIPVPTFFPIELLFVCGDQKVPLEKSDRFHSETLLRENAVDPKLRKERTEVQLKKLGLWREKREKMSVDDKKDLSEDGTNLLTAFGVSIINEFIPIRAGVRVAPTIEVANSEKISIVQKTANWEKKLTNKRYFSSVEITNWAVICSQISAENPMIVRFLKQMVNVSKRRGIRMDSPMKYSLKSGSREDFDDIFRHIAESGRHFVMYFSPLKEKQHDLVKWMEHHYSVVTQHVCLERIENVVTGRIQILDNIIHKANMKLGGLNVIPRIEKLGQRMEIESGDFLVIAYDVCHPAPMTSRERVLMRSMTSFDPSIRSLDPSVVGIVANCVAHPHAFVGDYHYQASRKESVDGRILVDRVKWIFELLAERRPNASRPKHIIILRDGVSEGQYKMAEHEELSAIRRAVAMIDPNYHPTFTLVIATKRHNKRFYDKNEGIAVNTEPGTIIDKDVVRGDVTEFFLQSHFPLKGTVKMPQYAILCDEADFSQDEIQAFVNCLCHSHQIVASAVSIPEPIYAADELAKRGSNNFAEHVKIHGRKSLRKDPMNPNLIDFEALTHELAYWKTNLEAIRFNA
ncbi:hypothetical protein L596_007006 [Steinernema carpocapsae]|uniref:Piwi domain-containing protein n=1 Tax=Steinernema carpocapsae TaxID=34508 RepID=A0A4U5P8C2_STECR|nr:hypothetical protein L596_007006 [Steinernema carpocapsae]